MWVEIKNSKKKKVSIKYLIYEKHHTTLQLVMLCESSLTVLFISLFLSVFKYFINISFSIVRLEAAKKIQSVPSYSKVGLSP